MDPRPVARLAQTKLNPYITLAKALMPSSPALDFFRSDLHLPSARYGHGRVCPGGPTWVFLICTA